MALFRKTISKDLTMKTETLSSPIRFFFCLQIILLLVWVMALRQTFLFYELEKQKQAAPAIFVVNIMPFLSAQHHLTYKNSIFLLKKKLIISQHCTSHV